MRYAIRRAVLDSRTEISITAEEFCSLRKARCVLTSALAVEEKYALLVSNYLDLEKKLLELAAAYAIAFDFSYQSFFDTRTSLNIRMVNLLTGARLYLDHIPQDVADCLSDASDEGKKVKSRCSQEYDGHLEYRFMEALRNHVQHRGMAVHGVSMPSRRVPCGGEDLLEYSISIHAHRATFEQDLKFKRSALTELPDHVDLLAAARRYVESLSSINEFVRGRIAEPVREARETIERARSRFSECTSESLIGLEAAEFDGQRRLSSIALLLDWDDVRVDLQKRNRQLVNLVQRMISSRVQPVQS